MLFFLVLLPGTIDGGASLLVVPSVAYMQTITQAGTRKAPQCGG